MSMKEIFYPLNLKNIKHAFNCVFNDRISQVGMERKQDGTGFKVVVEYMYKGLKAFDFNKDDERYLTTYGSAEAAAQSTYNLYANTMCRQRQVAR